LIGRQRGRGQNVRAGAFTKFVALELVASAFGVLNAPISIDFQRRLQIVAAFADRGPNALRVDIDGAPRAAVIVLIFIGGLPLDGFLRDQAASPGLAHLNFVASNNQ